MINFTETEKSIIFTVRIVPRASKSEIIGELAGALKIRISAPPVDGAANAELVKFLSKTFGVSKSEIEILSGSAAKIKLIKVSNPKRENFLKIF